jgi:hypothetical protein
MKILLGDSNAKMGGGGIFKPIIGNESLHEDNIKMNLREIWIDGVNCIRLAQNKVQWRAFVKTVMNLRIP